MLHPQWRRQPFQSEGRRILISILGLILSFATNGRIETHGQPQQRGDFKATPLELREPLERELRGGQTHSYLIAAIGGQYARINVEQRGIDVVLALFARDGKKLIEADWTTGTRGQESLSIIADASGVYRLEVRASVIDAVPGKYAVRIDEMHAGTEEDRSVVAAQASFSEAEQLRTRGGPAASPSAITRYETALDLYHKSGDHKGEADVESRLGVAFYELGEIKQALDSWASELVTRRVLGDQVGEADALMHLGDASSDLGDKQNALQLYSQALSLAHAFDDPAREARNADRLSRVYNDLGETQEALNHLDTALHLYRSIHDRSGEASVFTTLGLLYNSLGENPKALDHYNKALAIWRAVGNRVREADTLKLMGTAYNHLGEYRRALAVYERALAYHHQAGNTRGEAATLHTLAWTYFTLGDKPKALAYNAQALSLMKSLGDRNGEAAIYTNLGWIHELSGEPEQALDYYKKSLPLMMAVGDWNGERNTLYRLANVVRDSDNLSEARDYIEAALAITESVRTKVASQELRASFRASVQRYWDFYIDLLMRMHERSRGAGYDIAALQASERARARGLLDLLTEASVDIRKEVDPSLLVREQNLQGQITGKTNYRIHLLNGRHTEREAAETTKEIEELVSAYQEVEAQIRVSSPRYAALTQPQALTLPRMQNLLDADTLLLEYTLGETRSYLWAVTTNSITSVSLEKASVIEAAARRSYELLTARMKRVPNETLRQRNARIAKADVDYDRAAADLSLLLRTDLATQSGKRRLAVVSDGALQYIPFAALPELGAPQGSPPNGGEKTDRRPSAPASTKPLILDHELVSLPSVSTLALLRRERDPHKTPTKTIVVFADPVFEATDTRVNRKAPVKSKRSPSLVTTDKTANGRGFSDDRGQLGIIRDFLLRTGVTSAEEPLARLPYSRKEALAIASLVPEQQRKIVLDFDVNYQAVTSAELADYRFVHFATHSLLDTDEPELSGILLSLVDSDGHPRASGILRLGDLYNLNLPVELVSLSGCDTALGKSISGEGLVGLTRGFMYAGTPRVVASLWKVDDRATADLMKIFYEGMLGPQKLRPAAALREAQEHMRQRSDRRSPFYWAGFVLEGEWR
jgi:tetratricopeptide (TPR) repeat protein